MKPPIKQETLLAYLEKGIAMLHLDARRPGVSVPPQHADDVHLRINLSYRFGIPDLVIDERRVQASLSFGGRSFQCQIPWTAVFGITSQQSGQGQVWPEDLPREVMQAVAEQELAPAKEPPAAGKKSSRPALVAVSNTPAPVASPGKGKRATAKKESAQAETPPSPPPEGSEPRKSHLRIVR